MYCSSWFSDLNRSVILCALAATACLAAEPSVALTDAQILEHAREANSDLYESLQSFVCHETVERFRTDIFNNAVLPVDTVQARLSFERGVEQYSNIVQNQEPRRSMESLPGAWSEGEFGTLLLQTEKLLNRAEVVFENFTDLQGTSAALYHLDVPESESPWDLSVSGHHYKVGFRTLVWISVATGEILRMERVSLGLDPRIRIEEIRWAVSLDRFELGGQSWLLPASGTYVVKYRDFAMREWNQLSFSSYRRYGAQTSLEFN